MRIHLKRAALMLLCIMTIAAPAGGAAAVYATDTSQSYRFDLTVNGGQSCSVKAGDNVEVSVTLTRTDSGAGDTFTMYAVQYDLMVDTRFFTIDSSKINGGGTKGVQTFTTDMSKNGSWAGYKKITAAAVNASGSSWSNGSVILKCTLEAIRSGETELKPYNSIVSLSTGMDTYSSQSNSVKVMVAAPDDENGGEPSEPGDTGETGGNTGGNSGVDQGNTGTGGNSGADQGNTGTGSSGNAGNTGNAGGSGGSTGSSGTGTNSGSGSSNDGNQTTGNDVLSAFTDTAGHWSREYIEYTVKKGYFSGITTTRFEPDRVMTRAMLVTVLWRMESEPAYNGSSAFSDVSADIWYGKAVNWAAGNGIVSGTGNGRFMPESPVTREQLIQIIRNYAKYRNADITPSAAIDSFRDASAVSSWARDAFSWGISTGMISGTGNNSLSPKGEATRAQVAKILTEFDRSILKNA